MYNKHYDLKNPPLPQKKKKKKKIQEKITNVGHHVGRGMY